MTPARLLFPVVLALTLLAGGAPGGVRDAAAKGWEEVHQTSDDVRLTVGPDGSALVTHHLRFRVVNGHFKAFDFTGVDAHAQLVTDAVVLPEKGGEIPAHVEENPKTPGAVRIVNDDPRGLTRGVYVVDVKYTLDLVATKMLVKDGAMWRLGWTSPPSPEGHDGARVVFELPSAPTEPRLASPEQATTTLATLRREPEHDELELVRAHIPRGDAVTWSARVDPKAFPRVTSAELRPPVTASIAAATSVPDHVPFALLATGAALLAAALAYLLREKQAFVVRACAASGVTARPLVPLRSGVAPLAFGVLGTGALGALLWSTPAIGAVLVVLAMLLATHRAPLVVARPRGPGRWQPIADADVLVKRRAPRADGDVLDLTTRTGLLVFLAAAAVLAALSFVLRARVAGAAVAIPLAAAALVPLFVTGTRAQLPRLPSELAARLLAPARDMLGRLVDLAHVEVRCLARFGEGTTTFDEVRLTCAPSDPIPGLRSIELALASAPGAAAALPEVLVRFDDGSAAASRIAALAPGIRVVPGRSPEEKVLRLAPRLPTPAGAARLLARLASDLEGRREGDRASGEGPPKTRKRRFAGIERRLAKLANGKPVAPSACAAAST
ncbi:MAG: hypothetical protein JWP97_3721 [Labilithrix sp.]|nr:hypothetical protein [Labilithrix sp.]